MAEKILNTRILLKYDTLANWEASTGILRAGEVAIATVPEGSAGKEVGSVVTPQVLVKVGDGKSTFKQLPYITAKAGDVYAWAKQAHPVYISGVNEETGAPIYKNLSDEILAILGDVANLKTFQNGNPQVIANAIKEAKDYTDAEIKKLTHVTVEEDEGKTGNVVTNVTQANGIVTVTKGTLAVSDLEGGQDVLTDISNINTEIAKVKTTATENLATAKGYTDTEVKKLADGAVAANTAAIEVINSKDVTKEGSIAKAVKDAKDYADGQVSNAKTELQGYADKAEEDAVKTAKDYVDAEIAKVTGNGAGSLGDLEKRVAANEAAIGTMPAAGEDGVAPTLVGMIAAAEKAADDAVKAEAKRASDAELALDGRLDTVEAFFEAALEDGDGQQVIDTLKEIQDYIKADETGAAGMLASIKANTDAIGVINSTDATKEGSLAKVVADAAKDVADEETRAKGEEARIEGLANAAQGTANQAVQDAAAAQETADDALEAIGAKTDAATAETVYGAIAAEKARAEGKEGELNTAITNEVTNREAAVKAINDKIGDGLEGEHTTLIGAINAANSGVSTNAGEISGIKKQLAGITGTDGILGQAKAYTDAEIVKVNNAITTLSGEVVKTVKGDDVIKASIANNELTIDFDDTLTFVFNCGTSANLDPAQA